MECERAEEQTSVRAILFCEVGSGPIVHIIPRNCVDVCIRQCEEISQLLKVEDHGV